MIVAARPARWEFGVAAAAGPRYCGGRIVADDPDRTTSGEAAEDHVRRGRDRRIGAVTGGSETAS
jgi:hypothetical protein